MYVGIRRRGQEKNRAKFDIIFIAAAAVPTLVQLVQCTYVKTILLVRARYSILGLQAHIFDLGAVVVVFDPGAEECDCVHQGISARGAPSPAFAFAHLFTNSTVGSEFVFLAPCLI